MKLFLIIVNLEVPLEGARGRSIPLEYTWFEDSQRKLEKRMMCSGESKLYWNELESNRALCAVDVAQLYSFNTKNHDKG